MTTALTPAPGEAVGVEGQSHRRAARRGGRLFFVASLFSQASTLLRYVVLARLLGPEQLGIATTLMVTGAFFDLISDTGSDRFLVQDREGGTIAVQRLVHLVFVVRGALIAAALVLLAKPIAGFYKTPAVASGLIILALSPLILGFLHLDVRRTQRDHDFRSQAIGTLVADCVSLVATVILALVTRDYTAVVYGMITRAAVVVLMSHLTARRPYSLGWDPGHGSRLSHFAAPLMLNGFLLFVITQGDRVIVGHEWGLRVLGLYSATTLLIYYPASLLAHYLHNLYIPLIAAERDAPAERDRIGDALGGQTLLLAVALTVGFAIVTPTLAPAMFGPKFVQTPLLVALIGILQATRLFLSWPTTVALSMGRSATVLTSNLAHIFAFLGAVIGISWTGDLTGMLVGFILGEFIAVALALALLNRNLNRPLLSRFDRLAVFILVCGAVIAWDLALRAQSLSYAVLLCGVSLGLVIWLNGLERPVMLEVWLAVRRWIAPALSTMRARRRSS